MFKITDKVHTQPKLIAHLLFVCVLGLVLAGCCGSGSELDQFMQDTAKGVMLTNTEPFPVPQPLDLPIPSLQIPALDGSTINGLCLDTEHSYPTGNAVQYMVIDDDLTTIISDLGIKIVQGSDPCDNTLFLSTSFGFRGGELLHCYTGYGSTAKMMLQADGVDYPLGEVQLNKSPDDSIILSLEQSCEGNSALYPDLERSFQVEWNDWVVRTLAEIWGPRVDLSAMRTDLDHYGQVAQEALEEELPDRNLVLPLSQMLSEKELLPTTLEYLGVMGDISAPALPYIYPLFDDEDASLRYLALITVGQIGPAAIEAVPVLLDSLVLDTEHQETYLTALERITGESFQAAGDYRDWWYDNQP